METDQQRQRLQAMEKDLSTRTRRETASGREQTADSARDSGDASVADEAASEAFAEAELSSGVLSQVRDALRRIDAGTFGACIVDGGPIEPKRLEAMPWTPYCLKHQALLDVSEDRPMPTL